MVQHNPPQWGLAGPTFLHTRDKMKQHLQSCTAVNLAKINNLKTLGSCHKMELLHQFWGANLLSYSLTFAFKCYIKSKLIGTWY